MIYPFLCFVTHTKLPKYVAITRVLWYNSIIDKRKTEQNILEFQVGTKKVLLTLYRALSDSYIFLLVNMNYRLIRLPEVEELCGVCGRTIYRNIAKGIFPKPIVLAKNVNGISTVNAWRLQDILDWIGGLK